MSALNRTHTFFIMPANYLEAKTELLDFAKRPQDSEWLAVAGNAINESLVKLQRIIPDMHAISKVVGGFTYTADADQVSFVDAVQGTDINKVISVELTTGGALVGTPLRCYTYRQLAMERAHFEETKLANSMQQSFDTHERYVTDVFKYFSIVLGTDLMLYPKPAVDVTLALHYTPWLAALSADEDTNILLKYCWDFIFYASLFKLNVLLSEADRLEVNNAALNYALNEVRSWNSSMAYSNPIDA